MTNHHQLAGIAKHANVGMADGIRALLKSGPKSKNELAEALGIDPHNVKSMVQQLCARTGGVEVVPGSKPRRYALIGTKPQPQSVRAEFKPLHRDPFEHMRLAMAGRR